MLRYPEPMKACPLPVGAKLLTDPKSFQGFEARVKVDGWQVRQELKDGKPVFTSRNDILLENCGNPQDGDNKVGKRLNTFMHEQYTKGLLPRSNGVMYEVYAVGKDGKSWLAPLRDGTLDSKTELRCTVLWAADPKIARQPTLTREETIKALFTQEGVVLTKKGDGVVHGLGQVKGGARYKLKLIPARVLVLEAVSYNLDPAGRMKDFKLKSDWFSVNVDLSYLLRSKNDEAPRIHKSLWGPTGVSAECADPLVDFINELHNRMQECHRDESTKKRPRDEEDFDFEPFNVVVGTDTITPRKGGPYGIELHLQGCSLVALKTKDGNIIHHGWVTRPFAERILTLGVTTTRQIEDLIETKASRDYKKWTEIVGYDKSLPLLGSKLFN